MGIIDPMQRNSQGAQGYKDGRSREITTSRSQPITQGVIGPGGNPGLNDLNSVNLAWTPKMTKQENTAETNVSQDQEEKEEEFPSWAGNTK